jgi:hypothetical protein
MCEGVLPWAARWPGLAGPPPALAGTGSTGRAGYMEPGELDQPRTDRSADQGGPEPAAAVLRLLRREVTFRLDTG